MFGRMLKEVYVHIDGGLRDLTAYPDRGNFKMSTQMNSYSISEFPLRNVQSVELLGLTVPNLDNILDEPYLILDIDELNKIYAGNPQFLCTAVLHLQNPIIGPTHSHIAMCRKVAERSPLIYRPPKSKITSLTIRVCKSDGSSVNFGQDTKLSFDRQNQISLHLKFLCEFKDPSDLLADKNDY